ncbi:Hypothetical predicted protein [Mytilus galloprovincialis]|uniref:Cadherin domain-containing protein n=1 Tax=Mytilus galloprovincialis TaxID=29158 RepID=A0A8B6CN25_MYTGA|nr:Hypothetical predicted protein [Mytilus galloprovincialis]
MFRKYVAVLTILMFEYTTALVLHKPPIIHTNHPYLNIKENSRAGTEFVIIDASSQTNDTVTITTHDNATAARVFLFPTRLGINSTYRVALKKIPDREDERTWYLTFKAHDNHGDTSWTLPLHIDDENDNAPLFAHDHYHSVVGYGLAVGSKILHVTAMDADEGPNAAIKLLHEPLPCFISLVKIQCF